MFLQVWPRVKLLACWPLLVRQSRAKKVLLCAPELHEEMTKPQLAHLRSTRSHAQFIREIVISHWIQEGERAYANWLRSVYLVTRWDRWHINGAGVFGVIPNLQGIESHHSVIKRTCVLSTRAYTGGVMNGILPRILSPDGEDLRPDHVFHFCAGPVLPEILLKAQRLTSSKRDFGTCIKEEPSGGV